MRKRYQWDEYRGMGNRLKKGYNPLMLTDDGYIVAKEQKLTRGNYPEYQAVEIVYDKSFVLAKLLKETIEPLAITETAMIELVSEAYKQIKGKQQQLTGIKDE